MNLPPFSPANLGAATQAVLGELRVAWLSLATDRIVIDRVIDSDVGDDGREVNTYRTIYAGPGLSDSFMAHERNSDVGGSTVTVQRLNWQIPAAQWLPELLAADVVDEWDGPVQTGDRARRFVDGEAVKTVRITGEHDITHAVQQRLYVDEITGGVWS